MNKRLNVKLAPTILLLIYAISISPAFIFHHHDTHIIAYDDATPCEKTIYFGEVRTHCGHQSHISEFIDKCLLCDQQFNLLFTFDFLRFSFFNQKQTHHNTYFYESYLAYYSSLFFNKGPPTV